MSIFKLNIIQINPARLFTLAALAALAPISSFTFAQTAPPMTLSDNGTGQVLIFPYYTANGGNQTIFSIQNPTSLTKVINISYHEARNGREVLDYHIYLTPYDSYSASIFDSANNENGLGNDGVPGPGIISLDTSCTVPMIVGSNQGNDQEFFRFPYARDGGPADATRAAEGFFVVYELGDLLDNTHGSAEAAKSNCQQLVDAWSIIGGVPGYWRQDPNVDIGKFDLGITGHAAIVNAEKGTLYSIKPVAIKGFSSNHLNAEPGDISINLGAGSNRALVYLDTDGDQLKELTELEYASGIEAVSALLMKADLNNAYLHEGPLNAVTEWVLTYPTKQFYADPEFAIGEVPVAPFTQAWTRDPNPQLSSANELFPVLVAGDDQDPVEYHYETDSICFPVFPASCSTQLIGLKTTGQVNVVTIGQNINQPEEGTTCDSDVVNVLRSRNATCVSTGRLPGTSEVGRINIDLSNASDPRTTETEPLRKDSQNLLGLPVIGFALQQYTNNNLVNGTVRANYGNAMPHVGQRRQPTE